MFSQLMVFCAHLHRNAAKIAVILKVVCLQHFQSFRTQVCIHRIGPWAMAVWRSLHRSSAMSQWSNNHRRATEASNSLSAHLRERIWLKCLELDCKTMVSEERPRTTLGKLKCCVLGCWGDIARAPLPVWWSQENRLTSHKLGSSCMKGQSLYGKQSELYHEPEAMQATRIRQHCWHSPKTQVHCITWSPPCANPETKEERNEANNQTSALRSVGKGEDLIEFDMFLQIFLSNVICFWHLPTNQSVCHVASGFNASSVPRACCACSASATPPMYTIIVYTCPYCVRFRNHFVPPSFKRNSSGASELTFVRLAFSHLVQDAADIKTDHWGWDSGCHAPVVTHF